MDSNETEKIPVNTTPRPTTTETFKDPKKPGTTTVKHTYGIPQAVQYYPICPVCYRHMVSAPDLVYDQKTEKNYAVFSCNLCGIKSVIATDSLEELNKRMVKTNYLIKSKSPFSTV